MLNNKVIVITGGAGLIGKEFVRELITQHAYVIIADIAVENAQEVKKAIRSDQITCLQMDITSSKSIKYCIDMVDQQFGRIDALINNAYPRNKNYGKHFFDVSYEDFVANVGMNLGGYFLTSQQFASYFTKQGYGNIVNIASIYGVVAPKFEIYQETPMTTPVEYAAIKSALIHLTKYMAKYLKGSNIRVNSLSPGGIFDYQPQIFLDAYQDTCLSKGMLEPKDLSGTLVYLLSDMSQYINGQNIVVDDGFTL